MNRDLAALAQPAAELLRRAGHDVAVAESSTGGLISAALLAVPGASDYYRGGSVVYTLESRRHILGIRRADVDGLEPLTEAMVERFAHRARAQVDASWAVAELGVAGPTPARYGHDAGLSVLAVVGPCTLTRTVNTGHNDREQNMWEFTAAALALLTDALKQHLQHQ